MCMSCGCRVPDSDHGDPDDVTTESATETLSEDER